MGQTRFFTPAEVCRARRCKLGSQAIEALEVRELQACAQVAQHNTLWDCWVTLLGRVFNVTSLLKVHAGPGTQPIVAAAGSDISSWIFPADWHHTREPISGSTKHAFSHELARLVEGLPQEKHPDIKFDATTGDVKTSKNTVTGLHEPDCPQGKFIHVAPAHPSSQWDGSFQTPWWQDEQYVVGRLTAGVLRVLVRNVMAEDDHILEVPQEETLEDIQKRYTSINRHAGSYVWTALPDPASPVSKLKVLDMAKTLHENRVFGKVAPPESVGEDIPTIHLYWTDDLTVG